MSEESVYLKIWENIDQAPQRAPKADGEVSKAFIEFLKLLYTPEEAELVQHLKIGMKNFKSAADIGQLSGKSEDEVNAILEPISKKGRVIGFGGNYMLPSIPQIFNNHQFYPEVKPDDVAAAELYQQFFIKDGFYKYYESSEKGTQIMRVIPVQRAVKHGQKVLDSEEAHKIIDACSNLQLVPCPCRTRTEKMGVRECKDDHPVASCIMPGTSASYFQALGMGEKVTADEAKKYFDEMQDQGLVGTTENFEDPRHAVICLCCSCCCSQIRGRTRWQNPDAVAPSNFVPEADEGCVMCGDCVDRCFFGAITIDEEAGRAVADADKCIGCGVCAIGCEQEVLRLKRVERETPYPSSRELFKKVAKENREG